MVVVGRGQGQQHRPLRVLFDRQLGETRELPSPRLAGFTVGPVALAHGEEPCEHDADEQDRSGGEQRPEPPLRSSVSPCPFASGLQLGLLCGPAGVEVLALDVVERGLCLVDPVERGGQPGPALELARVASEPVPLVRRRVEAAEQT